MTRTAQVVLGPRVGLSPRPTRREAVLDAAIMLDRREEAIATVNHGVGYRFPIR
jgi:hypothetical protein